MVYLVGSRVWEVWIWPGTLDKYYLSEGCGHGLWFYNRHPCVNLRTSDRQCLLATSANLRKASWKGHFLGMGLPS